MPGHHGTGRPVGVLVLTRDPTGRASGRKAVLATAAHGMEGAGLAVEAIVLSRTSLGESWEGRPLHHVRLPGLLTTAVQATLSLLGGRRSLNEALFDSRRVRRAVSAVAGRAGAGVVVADGLRTSAPAMACAAPVLVHLDDLLSDRYAALAADPDPDADLLGFFAEQIPRRLRPAARRLIRRVLALEARRVRRREGEVATLADAVAMTSTDEACELTRRTGRPVASLPMAVATRAPADPAAADPGSLVFLGLLDYAPNRAALAWWCDEVRPRLDALGGGDLVLTVVGHADVASDLPDDERLRFTGYVPDLGAELRRHRAMVAPVRSGAGVKTKVLDGWSVGLPVVATPAGAAGLTGADGSGEGLLVADSAEGFARAVLALRDDGARAARIGQAGRQVLERDWSPAGLTQRWAAALEPLLSGPGRAPR